jgi:hypothetical protein
MLEEGGPTPLHIVLILFGNDFAVVPSILCLEILIFASFLIVLALLLQQACGLLRFFFLRWSFGRHAFFHALHSNNALQQCRGVSLLKSAALGISIF